MKNVARNLCRVVLLAALMAAVTSCTEPDPSVEATSIALGVQATLTAEAAINAAVETRVQATQSAMEPLLPPTGATVQPAAAPENDIKATVEAGIIATQTAMSAPESQATTPPGSTGPVTISIPANGAVVSQYELVSGFVDRSALSGKFLNVIVTTQTREHWVQTAPDILDEGTWTSDPVYLGSAAYGAGETFKICAVIADRQLPVGQIFSYPDGPSACVEVTREN